MQEIYKAEILKDTIKELENFIYSKIHKNSNSYKKLKLYINTLIQEEFIYQRELNTSKTFNSENLISVIKIKTDILNSLFEIKKDFSCRTISETLELLSEFYMDDRYYDRLNKINECVIPIKLEKNLNKSYFYICECENIDNKVIYYIDDVIIKNNIKYLDLRKFKLFKKSNYEEYLFSSRFNLDDLDEFYNIINGSFEDINYIF